MNNDTFTFTATVRAERGTAEARRLRLEQDRVPAVVYGAGQPPQAISLLHKDLLRNLGNDAVFSSLLTLVIDNQTEQVILKDIRRHPYKSKIVHVDFLRVKTKEKIDIAIPLHFAGEADAPGVVEGNGVYTKHMTEVEVRCLPKDLPSQIVVDVSHMEINQTLHLTDLKLPEAVELSQAADETHDLALISLHAPRVEREPTIAEEEEAIGPEEEE